MASKGWGLLLIMLGLLGGVLLVGTLGPRTRPTVQVSPQGSAIILSHGGFATSDGTTNLFTGGSPRKLSPQPLSESANPPVFSLPALEQPTSYDEQARALTSALAGRHGVNSALYH